MCWIIVISTNYTGKIRHSYWRWSHVVVASASADVIWHVYMMTQIERLFCESRRYQAPLRRNMRHRRNSLWHYHCTV